jgi:hypothetical protein
MTHRRDVKTNDSPHFDHSASRLHAPGKVGCIRPPFRAIPICDVVNWALYQQNARHGLWQKLERDGEGWTAAMAFLAGEAGKRREDLVKTGRLLVLYPSCFLPARARTRKFDGSLKGRIP